MLKQQWAVLPEGPPKGTAAIQVVSTQSLDQSSQYLGLSSLFVYSLVAEETEAQLGIEQHLPGERSFCLWRSWVTWDWLEAGGSNLTRVRQGHRALDSQFPYLSKGITAQVG